ncbi:MAG TPA: hypothetical protein VM262_16280 [Acidimicrobiales bacterium]|nr:hypothetical protein [Acidimicrobiales bacterium]
MIRQNTVSRFLLLVALTTVALVAPASLAQQQAPESVGIRLVDAPVDRRDDPRAQRYIVDHVSQGTTITRHVEVSSTMGEPVTIALYVAAATLEGGRFAFGEGRAENDLTDWSAIDPSEVDIPPGGAVQATVTIAVPAGAEDGERYGVIWAELPGGGGSANVVNRVGVRIYLSVGEGNEPASDFTIDTLRARRDADGVPIVETAVTNTGGRAIDLSGSLVLENGPGSLSAGPVDVQVGTTLAPGTSAPARALLDPSLPDGPWDATVTIRAGRLERTASATLTFPDEAGEAAATVVPDSDSERRILIPIAAAAALLAGMAAAVYALRRRALRRAQEQPS